jgi:DNA-binding transcriptional ArsR family regulator
MTTTIDQQFAALADPTRVELVTRLARGPASVTDLAEPYTMSLRAVLKHVHVLEEAGLVRTVKEGRVRRCELDGRAIASTARFLDDVRTRWERRLDRMEDYVRRYREEKS